MNPFRLAARPLQPTWRLLRELLSPSHMVLPAGDVRQLVADTLRLVGVAAVLMYLGTVLFVPVANWGTRITSGLLAFLPFVLGGLVLRNERPGFAFLVLASMMVLGTVWVLAAGSVHTAHVSFFMLPLVFMAFMYGARAAGATLLLTGGLLAWLAEASTSRQPSGGPLAQAWLQFQFCVLVVVCTLTLRRYMAQAHALALQARASSARDAELAALGGRLSMTLQAARASAWEYRGDTGMVYTDGRLAAVLGSGMVDSGRLPGRLRGLLTPESQQRYDQGLARLLGKWPDDSGFDMPLVALRDGQEVYLHLICRIERAADGTALSAMGLVLDETERERERAQVRVVMETARREAEQANRAKTSFLANVSHDIRTPMSAVIGLTALALDSPEPARAREHVQRAHRAATSLLALLDDVLDLSRIEAGKLPLTPVRFALADLAALVRDTLGHAAAAKGLQLDTVIDPRLPADWVADRLRLQQVLQNLVGNALKFTPQGRVTLRLGLAADAGADADAGLMVEVSDTGIGLDETALRRVFEPFEQGDDSTARQHGGSGLGLAISRQLVQLMGGQLQVASVPGQGSCFWFVLPRGTVLEPAAAGPGLALRPRRGARVLLVEDSEDNQIIGTALLEKLGLLPLVAGDGASALALLATQPVDAVLMDIQMPGMDGLETTRRLRQLGGHCSTLPVIAMTAHALAEEALASLAAGMNDHLSKPVDLRLLENTLARWLPEDPHPIA